MTVEYKLHFEIAGEFGAEISFESVPGMKEEDLAAAIDTEKLAELLCIDALGYGPDDIAFITAEQYAEKYGHEEEGGGAG
jgi:hypothetical protein